MKALLSVSFAVMCAASAAAQSKPAPSRRTALNLFADLSDFIAANRIACVISNDGQTCNSVESVGLGWPKPFFGQQYVFASGLQVAGLIAPGAGFAWAGDTTGAFFMDPRGDQSHGTGRSNVFNSSDTADAAVWPSGAVVRDAALYDARLLGRAAVSEQDLWTRYWDGRPASLGGRTHPMGILVDQRLMAWNYPTGNDDVLYIVYTLYNVTARNAGVYANPTVPAQLQAEIAAIGQVFQDSVEAALAVNIPDGGYVLDSVYVGFFADHDIADFSTNYATVSVPFANAIV